MIFSFTDCFSQSLLSVFCTVQDFLSMQSLKLTCLLPLPILDTLSMSSLRLKPCLLLSISSPLVHPSFSLVQFWKDSECLLRKTPQVSFFFDEFFYCRVRFWEVLLFIWRPLFLVFLSSLLVWWWLCLIFPGICNFIFLQVSLTLKNR